jgi:hypothetical protein
MATIAPHGHGAVIDWLEQLEPAERFEFGPRYPRLSRAQVEELALIVRAHGGPELLSTLEALADALQARQAPVSWPWKLRQARIYHPDLLED